MNRTATVTARIEPELKAEVDGILAELGLSAPEAVQLLYRQIRLRRGLPFPAETPNRVTAKTLGDSRAGRNVKHFATKAELYADLGL